MDNQKLIFNIKNAINNILQNNEEEFKKIFFAILEEEKIDNIILENFYKLLYLINNKIHLDKNNFIEHIANQLKESGNDLEIIIHKTKD